MPYLTPDEIPEDDDCRPLFIPASTEWLAIVSGALTELTQSYNWEQLGAVTVDEAVERMQQMIDAYYDDPCGGCELPEGGKVIQIDEDGNFQELVNGEWVDPTGDYELPPIPAREEPTADERKCLAARNAANVFEQLYEQMTDDYNLDLDPAIALTAWVGVQSTVVLAALGFLSFGVATVLFGVWTLMYQALEFLTEDVWDEEFTEKLTCVLAQSANDDDGVVVFDYHLFMYKLAARVDLGDPSLGELRLYGQIWYMMLFLGRDGLNQMGATTEITEATCACGWCYLFDYEAPAPGLDFWTLNVGNEQTGAVYADNIGGSSYRLSLTIDTIAEVNLMRVSFGETFGANNRNVYLVNDDTATVIWGYGFSYPGNPIPGGGIITRADTIPSGTSLRLELQSTAQPMWCGYTLFEGDEGENPYGDSNCI